MMSRKKQKYNSILSELLERNTIYNEEDLHDIIADNSELNFLVYDYIFDVTDGNIGMEFSGNPAYEDLLGDLSFDIEEKINENNSKVLE